MSARLIQALKPQATCESRMKYRLAYIAWSIVPTRQHLRLRAEYQSTSIMAEVRNEHDMTGAWPKAEKEQRKVAHGVTFPNSKAMGTIARSAIASDLFDRSQSRLNPPPRRGKGSANYYRRAAGASEREGGAMEVVRGLDAEWDSHAILLIAATFKQ